MGKLTKQCLVLIDFGVFFFSLSQLCKSMGLTSVWLPIFFKASSFVFNRMKAFWKVCK